MAALPRPLIPRVRLETSSGTQTIRPNMPPSRLATVQTPGSMHSRSSREPLGDVEGADPPLLSNDSPSAVTSENYDADESSRSSRIVEKMDSTPTTVKGKKPSIFSLFSRKSKPIVAAENTSVGAVYDGASDDLRVPQQMRSSLSLRANDDASNLFARALIANQEERNALILPCNRERSGSISLHAPRERSASVSSSRRPSAGSLQPSVNGPSRGPSRASSYTRPAFNTPQFLSPSYGEDYFERPKLQSSPTYLDPLETPSVRYSPRTRTPSIQEEPTRTPIDNIGLPELTIAPPEEEESSEDSLSKASLGSWGCYPSHTRASRTGSAGEKDNVLTRDFALELCASVSDPIHEEPLESEPFKKKSKDKRKSKRVLSTMSQSRPVSFGRRFVSGYTGLFKSQSLEYMAYGHGHRTSISAGGMLEHPELEMLPPVFPSYDVEMGELGGKSK